MASTSSSYGSHAGSWQERLEEHCREAQFSRPIFQIVSDRRGGRTAWSSIVIVEGRTLPARFWYDGKNLNNAREDAAECAIKWLNGASSCQSVQAQAQPFHHAHHGAVWQQINQSG